MSKFFSTLFILCLAWSFATAQDVPCMPDPMFQDSVGVFPLPKDEMTNPDGGITEVACLNQPYEFVFTIVIGDTLFLQGAPFVLDSIRLDTEGAFGGLPSGLDYVCNPPNCTFLKDTSGCVVISGVPDNASDIGDNELTIAGTIFSGVLQVELTFPNPAIAPGSYSIEVADPDDAICTTSSLQSAFAVETTLTIAPNPVTQFANISFQADKREQYQLAVVDLLGRTIHQTIVQTTRGTNNIPLDCTDFHNGYYFLTLENTASHVTKRFVVHQ